MYRVTSLRFLVLGLAYVVACDDSSACPTEGAIRKNGVCDCPPGLPRYDSASDRCLASVEANVGDQSNVQNNGADSGASTVVDMTGDAGTTPEIPVVGGNEMKTMLIAAGGSHSCRLVTGSLSCWGSNTDGEVGPASPGTEVLKVVSGLASPTRVSLGWKHSCALLKDTTVSCWGNNESGQLGDRTRTSRSDPRPVPELSEGVEIAAGYEHTCARLTSGAVRCWGRNIVGQLGDGTDVTRPTPVTVGGLVNVVEIAAGGAHTCARHASGTVSCWGSNYAGQVGDGSTVDRLTPLEVPGLSGVTDLALGGDHSCARLASGQVTCWGRNEEGQLGDTTTTARGVPGIVVGLSGVAEVAAGRGHTCVRRESGQVTCWGSNASGELGVGVSATTLPVSKSPLDVMGLNDAISVVAGGDHSCALRPNGSIVCWGGNFMQQLGDGSNTNRSVPTPVRQGI